LPDLHDPHNQLPREAVEKELLLSHHEKKHPAHHDNAPITNSPDPSFTITSTYSNAIAFVRGFAN
jgi:hypothetical protein